MEKLDTTFFHEKRLDVALANHPKVLSRQQAKKIIVQNLIFTSCKKKITPSLKIKATDEIFFEIPQEKIASVEAVAHPLEIHYEDEYLLVVHKPAGLITHPADSHQGHTLLHYLLAHTNLSNIGGTQRQGIVHRIDKNTSGLLVVAKNDITHLALAGQFQKHSVHRKYLCLVCSSLPQESGVIAKNICRHPKNRKIFITHSSRGKTAITHWQVLQQWEHIKLVNCQLETGRTHQIRVHLSANQMPILGDSSYGTINKKLLQNFSLTTQQKICDFPRQALHAQELGFWHPQKQEKIFCTCPVPQDIQELLDELALNNISS